MLDPAGLRERGLSPELSRALWPVLEGAFKNRAQSLSELGVCYKVLIKVQGL